MKCPLCKVNQPSLYARIKKYTYYRCNNCKVLYLFPLPSQKILHDYYAKQFLYCDGLSNKDIIQKRSVKILKKLVSITPYAKTLCDVGSGYGIFLHEARLKGYKTVGIEPSLVLAKFAKKIFHVTSFVGTLEKYVQNKHAQFDIVTCIHVIEHVAFPKQFISHLLRLVKPGGVLYIETPNADSHLLYAEKDKYTFFLPPDHLWVLSKTSFLYLLSTKVQCVSVTTYSYSEHLMGIVKKILKPVLHYSDTVDKIKLSNGSNRFNTTEKNTFSKQIRYLLFDKLLAPLFTGLLNLHHKGSILELYIKK